MTTRIRRLILLCSTTIVLFTATGCHIDMWRQPKAKPQEQSVFFADGRASRDPIANTVARDHLKDDDALYTGKTVDGKLVEVFPFKMTKNDLERGRERFNIYCSPCHSYLGDGNGMIAQRGFALRRVPANFHVDRLRKIQVGHFFDVISNGYGVMFSYAARIPDVKDRWRIAAYIRVLQLSQGARASTLSPEDMQKLQESQKAAPPKEPIKVPAGIAPGLEPQGEKKE